jgi:hypothetical protein
MKQLCAALLLAFLIPIVVAEESSSPVIGELGANVHFKQDEYAANVAALNIEEHPEYDMSGLTSAMKSQQDAGMAAAENVASHEENDMSGLTSAMKSQQDAGMAAAENILENDYFDDSGISNAGKKLSCDSSVDSSIENTVSARQYAPKQFY